MKSAGKARNNGLYRHIRTSKEIIRNLLNDLYKFKNFYCKRNGGIYAAADKSKQQNYFLKTQAFTSLVIWRRTIKSQL